MTRLLIQELERYIAAIKGKKVLDLVMLDVRELTSVADVFMICSGRSNRQVAAIADHIHQTLKQHQIYPLSIEGKEQGHWVLLDYGHVIIHVFYQPLRQFYDLEGLWAEAKRLEENPGPGRKLQPINKRIITLPQNCCVLIILDGWGINPASAGNAVSAANTPFLDEMMTAYPSTRLLCSGQAVGLPDGVMGNSEVGHLNMGAGRVVYQDLLRIDTAIQDGSFFSNPAFDRLIFRVKTKDAALHLIGLVSDGGVHSHLSHLMALLELGKQKGLKTVFIHAITDGRDTAPHSGAGYLAQILGQIEAIGCGRIATICGRYYAMDRDTRWDRVETAYRLYTGGEGVEEFDPVIGLKRAYERGESDEFIKPIAITDDSGKTEGIVRDHDGIIFFNFRADRAREITRAFTEPGFNFFKRDPFPMLSDYVCTTRYDETFDLPVAFSPVHLDQILGGVIAENGLKQLRIAETEKYAHVTYFFNGGEEAPFPNEERCLIPSPRDVATYDLKPEMSAVAVTEAVLPCIRAKKYGLIVLNFANMDMVGHTGNMTAAVAACETVDQCVRDIVAQVKQAGGTTILTSDHGNAEVMQDPDGRIHTAHTVNPVPLILIDDKLKGLRLAPGILGDIAPTILEIMGIMKPDQMTGKSLLRRA